MAKKIICEICKKTFASEDGLKHHKNAKHSKEIEKPKKSSLNKKIIKILILSVIFGSLVLLIFNSIKKNSELDFEAPKEPIHWHAKISIIIDNVSQPIPVGIGLKGGIHKPIHTHERDGTIHLENENPSKKTVTLGYFFDIWGKKFNEECIFEYCTDKGELKMYVNGKENFDFENYFIQNGDQIIIEYKSNKIGNS